MPHYRKPYALPCVRERHLVVRMLFLSLSLCVSWLNSIIVTHSYTCYIIPVGNHHLFLSFKYDQRFVIYNALVIIFSFNFLVFSHSLLTQHSYYYSIGPIINFFMKRNRSQKTLKVSSGHIITELPNWKKLSLIWNTSLKGKILRLENTLWFLGTRIIFARRDLFVGYTCMLFFSRYLLIELHSTLS